MKIAIMTDSNSGIFEKEGNETGIAVISMPVLIDEETFFEGKNLAAEELFAYQTKGSACSTSQPSPGMLLDMWDELFAKGYEQIVYIPMSSGLSSSCSTAIALAQDYEGRVQVVDNHQISVTQRQAVHNAVSLKNRGMSACEIKKSLEKSSFETSIYIAVDTLTELKKGGRISPGVAVLATALNIKPVLTIQGEKLDTYTKCRGMKKAMRIMLNAVKEDREQRFLAWKDEEISIGVASTFPDQNDKDYWLSLAKEAFPNCSVHYDDLPCSIGCHLGAGAAGIGISRIMH